MSITAPSRRVDFDVDAPPRVFPNYQTKFITTHKNACRTAKFSPDGKYVVTGSADASMKLLDVAKMKTYNQNKSDHGEDFAPAKPVIRTFYDHAEAVNDVDFHPALPILASCSRDMSIKFFDYTQPNAKRAFKSLQDTHNVRSIHFHPSGQFMASGTAHSVIRLYDLNNFECYTAARPTDHHMGPINQV